MTTRWFETAYPIRRVEADIVFNSAFKFDSYRGTVRSSGVGTCAVSLCTSSATCSASIIPDEQGQNVNALMNSILGNLDSLTDDDIAGAQSLYGARRRGQRLVPAAQRAQ